MGLLEAIVTARDFPMPMNLADLIRQKLDEHRLPREDPGKVWGGYGSLVPCDACDDKILLAQVEYSFTIDEVFYRFHIGCFGLWEAERIRRGWSGAVVRATRAILHADNTTCVDCIARRASVSVDTLISALVTMQHHLRVTSTIRRCRSCRLLALVLRF